MRKRILEQRNCLNCNELFQTYPEDSPSRTSKYCKRKCYDVHGRSRLKTKEEIDKIILGQKKYFDKVGRTRPMKKRLRGSTLYATWRKMVFQRDNYTCQICNIKGVELNADHIKPFAEVINKFKQNTGLKEQELEQALYEHTPLWDTENGRTLCVECHRKTPTWGINQFTMKVK